ncbi:MAG: hemolysin, partial [Acidimicrobiia bacterium]|nr:hemolysin [Acidimicrobiia bacterium]
MNTTDWVYVGAIVVLIAFTGFLALAETALTRMNRVKALALEDEGHRAG